MDLGCTGRDAQAISDRLTGPPAVDTVAAVINEGRRAAIFAVSPDTRGLRGLMLRMARRRLGLTAGIVRVLLTDTRVGLFASLLYDRVNVGARSMTALQREMVATVVNGKIGGAP